MWMLSSLLEKESLQCLCKSCCQCPELQFVLSSSTNSSWHVISSAYLEPAYRRSWAPAPYHLVWEHLELRLSSSPRKPNPAQSMNKANPLLHILLWNTTGKECRESGAQIVAVTVPGWLSFPVNSHLDVQKAGNSGCGFACTRLLGEQSNAAIMSRGTHEEMWPSQESDRWCQKLVTH